MKNIEDYSKYGLEYYNGTIVRETTEEYIKSGRVKIMNCGCVYLDHNMLEEVCNIHINIDNAKQDKIKEINIYYDSSTYREVKLIVNSGSNYILTNTSSLRNWLNERRTTLHLRDDLENSNQNRCKIKIMYVKNESEENETIELNEFNLNKIFDYLINEKDQMYINKKTCISEINIIENLEDLNNYDYETKLKENLQSVINITV